MAKLIGAILQHFFAKVLEMKRSRNKKMKEVGKKDDEQGTYKRTIILF
jgi:hypothetical protein